MNAIVTGEVDVISRVDLKAKALLRAIATSSSRR